MQAKWIKLDLDFFNIIQLAWDIECMMAGDEACNNNRFTGENVMSAEHLKTA